MIKLEEILKNLDLDEDYKKLKSIADTNLYETYTVMGELLNPEHAFKYERQKNWCFYYDTMGNKHFACIVFNPTEKQGVHFEFKCGWFDENGDKIYGTSTPPNSTVKDWDKRSDTVAKIFRDEFIPFFLNEQNLSDVLKIIPLDIKRYQLFIRMVNKFVPKDKIEIIENKPKEIILKKIK